MTIFIHNKTNSAFISRVWPILSDIVKNEMKLDLKRYRFLLHNRFFPLRLTIFKGTSKLGFFDAHSFQIGLNQIMTTGYGDAVIRDVLRHEMAHYIQFIEANYGPKQSTPTKPHGNEFKSICLRYGWPTEICHASGSLDEMQNTKVGDLESEAILAKIQKLFQLAKSSNPHEATLATIKANQIMERFNLQKLSNRQDSLFNSGSFTTYQKRLLYRQKNCAKLRAIYHSLIHYPVGLCFNHGNEGVYLEAVGDYANIEMVNYAAHFLDQELDFLWNREKQKNPHLKGLQAKNHFFLGVGNAIRKQYEQVQSDTNSQTKFGMNAEEMSLEGLIPLTKPERKILEQQIQGHLAQAYRRLGNSRGQTDISRSLAFSIGQEVGEKVKIRQAVGSEKIHANLPFQDKKKGKKSLLLSFFK